MGVALSVWSAEAGRGLHPGLSEASSIGRVVGSRGIFWDVDECPLTSRRVLPEMEFPPTVITSTSARFLAFILAALPVVVSGQAPKAAPAPAPAPQPNIDPPQPYLPLDLFSLPEGLEVKLWARSPMLRQPTNMDIDVAGRIWVTEAYNYRRHQGKDPAGDRVMVVVDSDGDGVADRSHVFVQEPDLLAPLGIAVIDNKIVVSCAPHIIVYTDVNRDLKFDPTVDKREILLTGFDGRNHDHSLHSVTQGPDGKWYFNHGNAGSMFTDRSGRTFRVGSHYDPVKSGGGTPVFGARPPDYAGARSDDGHVYVGGTAFRMNADGTQVEPIGFNFRNSYEQTVTSYGDVFHNDNDDPPAARTSYLMEYGNLGFNSRDGRRAWRADQRPGQSIAVAEWRQDDPGIIPAGDVYGNGAPTGIVTYEGDELGEKWRGLLLSCETSRNVVFGYFPKPTGAGYALERFQFFTTNKEQELGGIDAQRGKLKAESFKTWFRPADVAVGPDGAIYVADWFDPRSGGHSAFDSSFAGAIYRITPKGRTLTVPALDLSTVAGQIAALKNPAVHVRALGFNALKAAGAASVKPVSALLSDANPYVRARAIHLLAHLGREGVALVEQQLKNPDPNLRITAFRALRRTDTTERVLAVGATLATDPSPAVRREVSLALRDVPWAWSRDLLLALAQGYDGVDRAYLEAWGIGATGKEKELYATLQRSAPGSEAAMWPARYAHLIWRLTPAGAEKDLGARARAAALSERERLAAVTALGFIPTQASADALIAVARQSDGMVKANAVWWLLNYKDGPWASFGIDAALKASGLYDPETAKVTPVSVPEPAPSRLPSAKEIAALRGDAAKGAVTAQACLLCHRIGDKGIDYGPALTGFGKAQVPEVVATAIIAPSTDIAHGYEGVAVTLKAGGEVHGLLLKAGDPLIVQSTGGLIQMIPAKQVRDRQSLGRSLMLSAEQLGLGAQEVADIIAYLQTQ
jgi:putative membrane-bound dehydrogenase-like protein